MDDNNIYSITAHLDLLGFSNHLILSSNDLRTKIGNEAISRLEILDKVIKKVKEEEFSFREYYPETFRIMRFNDSVILGIDIDKAIMPRIGKPNEGETISIQEIKKLGSLEGNKSSITQISGSKYNIEAIKVAKFLGLVSRIHNHINKKEHEIHMPGCRTIIASGLRYKFIDYLDNEDFYSANFSLSNAYIVNDLGSKHGFVGNNCYIENNVAQICSHNIYIKRLMGYSKFIKSYIKKDPFTGSDIGPLNEISYAESKKIYIDIFNKKYVFREFNTTLASNLQFFPHIISLITEQEEAEYIPENCNNVYTSLINMFTANSATVDSINLNESDYPLLYISTTLDEDIIDSYREIVSLKSKKS